MPRLPSSPRRDATESCATRGVRWVAPWPRGFDLETVYSAAVNRDAQQQMPAMAFVERLAAEETRKARIEAGFRGYAIRRATAADLAAIRGLVYGVLGEYGLQPDESGVDSDLADLE